MNRDEFPEKGMSFVEFVQSAIPGVDKKEADHILWEYTPFPLVQGRDDLMPYLVKVRERRESEAKTREAVSLLRSYFAPGPMQTLALHAADELDRRATRISELEDQLAATRAGDDPHVVAWEDGESFIKAARDEWDRDGGGEQLARWHALDDLLDDYRVHMHTGVRLTEHACDNPHCDHVEAS